MSTTIYYFTGTGNSLKIGETELISIARATDDQLSPTTDTVGIVFPTYAWGPPAAVARFLDRVKVDAGKYLFAVCTCGGSASGTLLKVKKQLEARGIALSSGFAVLMPTNYIVWGEALPEEKQQEMFATAAGRIPEICAAVKEKKVQEVEMGGLVGRILTGLAYRFSLPAFAKTDRKFVVGDACNGCGICEKVCPVANIEMADDKPTWRHHCEHCLACLQWCPQEAIEFGQKTAGRKRYHHPDIRAKDLM
jgi:ferredoxin